MAKYISKLEKLPEKTIKRQIEDGYCLVDLPKDCYLITFDRGSNPNKMLLHLMVHGDGVWVVIDNKPGIVKFTEDDFSKNTN